MFETPHCLLFGLPLSLGAFEMGEMHGAGLMTFANGDVYEGSMTRNVMQGAQGQEGEGRASALGYSKKQASYDALRPGSEAPQHPPLALLL